MEFNTFTAGPEQQKDIKSGPNHKHKLGKVTSKDNEVLNKILLFRSINVPRHTVVNFEIQTMKQLSLEHHKSIKVNKHKITFHFTA